MTQLTTATGSGVTGIDPLHLNADGSTIVGWGRDSKQQAVPVRWRGNVPGESYPVPLSYDAGRFFAVTADGNTLFGTYDVTGATTPFRWTETGGVEILMQSALQLKVAVDISADGSVLVGNTETGAFVWKLPNGQPELLATILQAQGANLGGRALFVTAISDDGSTIVGDASTPSSPSTARVAFLARWR